MPKYKKQSSKPWLKLKHNNPAKRAWYRIQVRERKKDATKIRRAERRKIILELRVKNKANNWGRFKNHSAKRIDQIRRVPTRLGINLLKDFMISDYTPAVSRAQAAQAILEISHHVKPKRRRNKSRPKLPLFSR